MNKIRHFGQKLYREFWQRRIPSGLMSPKYLYPGKDKRIRMHRSLWWDSYQGSYRILWLFAETWIWLRWVCFRGWLICYRALKKRGDQTNEEFGVSKFEQAKSLIKLCVGRTILPWDIYRFRLFLPENDAWDFVYERETDAFHDCQNNAAKSKTQSKKLLADKLEFSETLSDVPTATILECVSKVEEIGFSRWLSKEPSLFLKLRSGHRANRAFSCWSVGDESRGKTLAGKELPDARAVNETAENLLELGEFLVQPKLQNHPELRVLTEVKDAITIRYISRSDGTCLSATLEIQVGNNESGSEPQYVILPIESKSGKIKRMPDEILMPQNSSLSSTKRAGFIKNSPMCLKYVLIIRKMNTPNGSVLKSSLRSIKNILKI